MKHSILSTYSILDLVPQRPPMICVDDLVEINALGATSNFKIPFTHCFTKNNRFSTAGLLENTAQTCAARAGYLASESGQKVALGFIASFKHVICGTLPEVGQCIETTIEFKQSVLNLSIFSAVIRMEELEVLSCEVSILVEEDE